MEGQQTPLPIFEDSGTPQRRISPDHRSPSPVDDPVNQDGLVSPQPSKEVLISPQPSKNGSPSGIAEFMEEVDIDKEFFDSLPPGYRFCPSDSDLIVHYLQRKIVNDKLPRNQIRHVNLYHHSPEEISERYSPVGEKEWYFFTPRDRKYRNGTRPNRAAGSGYWKATGADKPVSHRGSRVGFRKALVYYEGKPPKGLKTNWIMHEYRVDGSPRPKTSLSDMRLDDFVLCRIYKKIDKSFKTRPHSEDPETLDQSGYPTEECEMFDQHNNAYLSDVDNRDKIHTRIFDKELKELKASAELMQFRDIHHAMDATSFAPTPKFYGNFSLPLNYVTKPLYFKTSMCTPESTFTSKYLNEASLEMKRRVMMHDNIWSMKDYDNSTLSSEFNLAAVPDFSTPVETLPDLDSLINNFSSSNSFDASANTVDSPVPKGKEIH